MARRSAFVVLAGFLCAGTALVASESEPRQEPQFEQQERKQRSFVQRPPITPESRSSVRGVGPAVYPDEYRDIPGLTNNIANPTWGSAGATLIRKTPVTYADGVGTPAGAGLKSAREISNLVISQAGNMPNMVGASDYLWQWGQFLDHDLDEAPIQSPSEHMDIDVPMGDPWFDPMLTGTAKIPLDRSAFVMVEGVRQQLNNITAYIDASNVYGSETHRADELRTLDGTGKLKTSAGDLLPFNVGGLANAPSPSDPTMFLAGDIRANEQNALTAIHTLFVREHNYWAEQIAIENPGLDGDEIYERARAIVAAEMQAITYNEFLPLLLGPNAFPAYSGYNPSINAGIANVFAAAAYRVGHTMLSSTIRRLDQTGNSIPAGDLELRNAFFNPSAISAHGIDPLLRGLASKRAQDIDSFIVDDVRNMLFGMPGMGGLDLASLNIQRGRDHGIGRYNQIRVAYGLPAHTDFNQVSQNPAVNAMLASAYDSVDDIDAWVGLLAEPHRPGALVGETLYRVLQDQFLRLRDGDRFWYESYLPTELVDLVNKQTLATIIRRNTSIGLELQANVFVVPVPPSCPGDVDGDLVVDMHDLNLVIGNFGDAGPDSPGDADGDGDTDIHDLNVVLGNFADSCP